MSARNALPGGDRRVLETFYPRFPSGLTRHIVRAWGPDDKPGCLTHMLVEYDGGELIRRVFWHEKG